MIVLKKIILAFFFIPMVNTMLLPAQTEVIRAVQYHQITSFEENLNISAMKMSSDGSRIVFSSSGAEVKVYTINIDGSGLVEVYDFQRTGSGVFVDISADGNTVIFSDGEGEIFIANADGSNLLELATLLPNPNPDFGDIEPYIYIPPRITEDGSQVLFIHSDRSPNATGVWRVNSNNTGLVQVFSFTEFWNEGLNRTDNISAWTNFSKGFDISADGSRVIFGANVLKLEIQDHENGDAYVFDGEEFYHLGDYRIGDQALATNNEGGIFLFFREELNSETNEKEISLYSDNLSGLPQVKVIEGISWPAFPTALQMSASGDVAMAQAGGGLPYDLPISYVNVAKQFHFDLVNCDDVSLALRRFRMSYSYLPSINHSGKIICFLEDNNIPQIWVGKLSEDGITTIPAINQISFDPPYVTHDMSVTSNISAHVISPGEAIEAVFFDALKEGSYYFRALTTTYPFRLLYDDGTHGDESKGDHIFTNDEVRRDLDETELGSYTIRISATDGQRIAFVDAQPFSIVENEPTGIKNDNEIPSGYFLDQNFPNPFNQKTKIEYSIPYATKPDIQSLHVKLNVYDLLGREVAVLVNEKQPPGNYSVEFDAGNFQDGLYFYRLNSGQFVNTKKFLLLK